jgi:biopolymer transport protein ExbD
MRRCSHTVHHSLSELNITPLLDLAFVLLVIFIITTAPLVNDLGVELPSASMHPKEAPRKANYITIEAAEGLFLNRRPVALESLLPALVELRQADPDLKVIVRGDAKTKYRRILQVMALLQQANVVTFDLATEVTAGQAR